MVSAQMAGTWICYRRLPNGNKQQIFRLNVAQTAPAGGASEGAPSAVSTPEKLLNLNSNVVLVNDDVLELSFISDAGGTIGTVTKSIWAIPIVTLNGSTTLSRAQFLNPTFTAVAIVANVETVLAGYRVLEGQLRVAGKLYLDLQNNA